ncbi:hypothetical protein HMPREF9699_00376 [Bergeyella zoohelcum ATCC 43767]|uniref:GTP-binding protein LepA C-terminal domain-containing protein n=1 Tax=Bergeyella zoohelcum ATCC 43767 TaxID=883096 RepID=K1LR23_9FLAO|nr:hypothetical protein [Bergeyella zoohelcum]EKB59440.1 hypothetical protein HMPREF9699_00376 [Bergeyella zoohelcum ATCC 43767]SUV49448.1 Elongation factor 4 [Bergeyella zoohelcum]
MSQNITDNDFPTQRIIEAIRDINTKIAEILSNPDVGFESISALSVEVENIIALLFDSVLEGEFVRNLEIKNDIQEIKNSLFSSEELENRLQGIDNQSVIHFLSVVREKIYLIENLLEEYIRFINNFGFLINQDKDYIFSISQNRRSIIGNEEEYNLFLVNLDLCVNDVQLHEHYKSASNIERLKSYIHTGGYLTQQKEKMLRKANFLLFKWYKRAEVDNKDISSIIDGEEKENYEEQVISYGERWKNMVEYINNHYFERRERELKRSFKQIKDEELGKYSCQDIHFYIKYYKDVEKRLDKLDEIIKIIELKQKDNVYDVILQYAINNRFSLFLKTCSNKDRIYEEYQKIKGDYKNYFPQYKFIDKIVYIINNNLQKENISLEEIKELESFINEKLAPEYEKYKANMEWSSQHSNFIYRVDYNECMIDNTFIYSSFVLPAPNKDAHDKYEILNSSYQALKTQIEPLKKVSSLLLEVNKNRVQVIELMGIFLAVIAFVMSSVSGFQFVEDIWSAILFLLVFSTGLISFLLVLLLITRHNENIFKKHWGLILIFYLGILGSICYIGSNKISNTDNIKNDATNKKNIEKQKEGKKKMKQIGRVEVPQSAFMAVLKLND